jgi:4-amino-4-deoxychorismate lyase
MMLVNGAPAQSIPATDRGLAYGDGIFRTFRAVNGEPLHWDRHYAKLSADCIALGISCPDQTTLLAETRDVARAQSHMVVKIIVTRGDGPRGYAPPTPCAPTHIVMGTPVRPLITVGEGVAVRLCRLRLSHQPALAGIKHLNRLENVISRAEWNDPHIAEGLLLDQNGFAIGGTMSNLFIVENGTLVTPDLSRCGVAGVTRARVMDIAAQLRTACRVEHLPLQRVWDADEVFLVNSVIGLWPVARLDTRAWRLGKTTIAIRQALEADDAALA